MAGLPVAHPRSRGENGRAAGRWVSSRGSSPLTRGKRHTCGLARADIGLIPAHAGKTSTRRGSRSPCGAHPRSRGENGVVRPRRKLVQGSSPLTRGKRCCLCSRVTEGGLIPAHAGKTTTPFPRSRSWWAHPRSRGENGHDGVQCCPRDGSSPLTRGKPAQHFVAQLLEGLIPAHAGKTDTGGVSTYGHGAHPRSRGENDHVGVHCLSPSGSSPLTRGKPLVEPYWIGTMRLIPAHAGKTPRRAARPSRRRAHPRSRGENRCAAHSRTAAAGSSPLTRGKLGCW